ncbi:UDP-N-acetylmuramoyl-tripeptide--D-alanyl-D-alanine ligase [Rhodovulum sp. DZ06]|uniref:UDP-N-acetylmuramoyl-tripeptide--D-alanyl-D- alanine ligase n=1 Tax=Rhodovulum sp. DZ06 TaxID=3425126 RepID=UPI003D33DA9D
MTDPLWTSKEAEAATGGRATRPWKATGVSIDSRSIAKGDLFVALADVRDGHDFVAAALEAGAAAAMVSRIPEGVPEGAPLLVVDDVLEGLRGLAAAARARGFAKVVAVTGSVGKTGVKEMLRACFAAQGAVHAAEKSFNNHWGVPLTLARMPRHTDFAVIEIGMNHPGEIRPLVALARPHAAIVTTVAPAHIGNFRDETEIAFAKAEIFEGIAPGGVAILNRDNDHYERLARRARRVGVRRILRFGAAPRCNARLIGASIGPRGNTTVEARLNGKKVHYKLGAPGRHLAMNSLSALLAVQAVGADVALAALALSSWTAPDGRGARWMVHLRPAHGGPSDPEADGTVELIDESYNANPVSMEAALEVLAAARPVDGVGRKRRGRRVAILGDMLELGPEEAAIHAALAALPAMAEVDEIHCVGPRMKALHKALPAGRRGKWRKTSEEMAAELHRLLDAGDVVMVKGSLGARMARVIEGVKRLGDPVPVGGETGEDMGEEAI